MEIFATVDACLMRECRKGTHVILDVATLWHDHSTNPRTLEMKLGDINEDKDDIKFVNPLFGK